MPKYRDVNFPALSIDAYLMLKDISELGVVDINQLMITGGSRTKEYNESLENSSETSRHLHGDGIDFGGKNQASDAENKKMWDWLNGNSPEAKQFKKDWNLEIIGNYGDAHMHLAVKDGAKDKSDRVKQIYAIAEPKWNATYGANGMIDLTQVSDEEWNTPIAQTKFKSEAQSKYYTNGEKGITDDRNAVQERDNGNGSGEQKSKPKQKPLYKDLSKEKKAEIQEKMGEFKNELSEAKTDEERKAVKEKYAELTQYGYDPYIEFNENEIESRKKEFYSKYGLEDIDEKFQEIEDLKEEKSFYTEGVDDESIQKIDEKIRGVEGYIDEKFARVDYEKKKERFEELKSKKELKEKFTPEEKAEYDKLNRLNLTDEQRNAAWEKLAKKMDMSKDNPELVEKMFKDMENGTWMHPYAFQTYKGEFNDHTRKEHGKGAYDFPRDSLNPLKIQPYYTEITRMMNQYDANGKLIPDKKNNNPFDGNTTHYFDINNSLGLSAIQEGVKGKHHWFEGLENIYSNIEEQGVSEKKEQWLTPEDFKPVVPGGGNEGNDDDESGSTDPNNNGTTPGNGEDDGKKNKVDNTGGMSPTTPGFQFDSTQGNWFDKAGGMDSVAGLIMAATGMADSGEIRIPERKLVDDMLVNHLMSVKRLSEIGMPLVEQAKLREELDTSFKMAKEAIVDAGNQNRGQMLSAISNLSGARQKAALDIEVQNSKSRRDALNKYGELTKYVNEFNTKEDQIFKERQFQVEKATKEAAGEMVAGGIDSIITAINNNKTYGKGSAHDMMNQWMRYQIEGSKQVEDEYSSNLQEKSDKIALSDGEEESKKEESKSGFQTSPTSGFQIAPTTFDVPNMSQDGMGQIHKRYTLGSNHLPVEESALKYEEDLALKFEKDLNSSGLEIEDIMKYI